MMWYGRTATDSGLIELVEVRFRQITRLSLYETGG
jgi:hypothetical protein